MSEPIGLARQPRFWIAALALAAATFAIGVWTGGEKSGRETPAASAAESATAGAEIWTCSMHPQIRKNAPGMCPICDMPLVRAESASGDGHAVHLSKHQGIMAGVETALAERRKLEHEVRAFGMAEYNERALATITARFDGYLERLFVDYTGVRVRKGDELAEIYSPELVVAQRELLLSLDRGKDGSLGEAAKTKLRRWEIPESQIEEILRSRKVRDRMPLISPIDGFVYEKMVYEKSWVKAGDVLYRLANLDSVWVYLDIYEYDLPWIRAGQRVTIASEAFPGEEFKGLIVFVPPFLNTTTRTIKARVNINNPEQRLKPGMFVSATIRGSVLADGSPAPSGLEGAWTCPMHPEVIRNVAGACPSCGMKLVQLEGSGKELTDADYLAVAVPASAVLDSGMRKVVYVEAAPGEFVARDVTVGPRAGDFYPILKGVEEGERVAVRGNFLIDSQAQILGHPSLLFEHGAGGAAAAQAHAAHGGSPPPVEQPAAATPHQH